MDTESQIKVLADSKGMGGWGVGGRPFGTADFKHLFGLIENKSYKANERHGEITEHE